ncbi:ubiquinone biosynthesis protein [Niveomyces insectorum RCEF 264]|uniref:Ubiquinone biosynthesis protein n=1 Tax=Niveomyces insectorum RCEF 264 TaxID=1081102 RepID=A0A162MRA6_9HYPO|nr:ubiquinone biosynthesis protein [Niveomyces insectorum RCEF 264]
MARRGHNMRRADRSGAKHQHHRRRTLFAAVYGGSAVLGAAAFAKMSEEETADGGSSGDQHGESTTELRMLEASRAELAKTVPSDKRGLRRVVRQVVLLLDLYVWEPLCTGLRFLQLSFIFVPVIFAVPAAWVGRRNPHRDNERAGALWWYGLLVRAMERAGPAFIKLGQWAASRTDIFPIELCEILSKLHSNAPAHSLRKTKLTIAAAFDGHSFDEIFEEFDETPLGVGAIAQVYRAKLRPGLTAPGGGGGEAGVADADAETDADAATSVLRQNMQSMRRRVEPLLKSTPQRVPSSYVAVKVLHPGVERTVRRDLRIMHVFASVLNAVVPGLEWLSLPDEVAQFGAMMKLQLDLRIEAANLAIFRRNFKDRTTAAFPFPYAAFTTRQVLVEEFAQGIPLAAFLEYGGGVFQHDIASEGLDAFLRMLLLDNFVHADLHPGNIMVRFYRAAQPDLSLGRTGGLFGGGGGGGGGGGDEVHPPAAQADVTEQVLARLRPFFQHERPKKAGHRRKNNGDNNVHNNDADDDDDGDAGWRAELAKLEAEGFHPQLVFLDTGLVTQLNATNRQNFLDLFRAVAEFDGYRAGHLMCARCRQPDAVLDEEVFALQMQHLVLSVKRRTLALGSVKLGDILQQVLGLVRTHHVRLEGDFVNVVISILLLEGIGRSLDPQTDLLRAALPILRQLGAQSGAGMMKQGDFSMLRIWVGLETRQFLKASVEDVERCVRYDLLSPNV